MFTVPLPRAPRLAAPLLAALFTVCSLTAQNTINRGLQGDPSMSTSGGWIYPAAPAGNPQPNPPTIYLNNRIQLGKALFWDEQVSTSNTMACGTCHIPRAGGTDPRPPGSTFNISGQPILGSNGVIPQAVVAGTIDYGFIAPASTKSDRLTTQIHVPTMIGAYMFNNQFWDMRAGPTFLDSFGAVLFPAWASLENQAVGPPTSEIEMGHQNIAWASGIIQKKLNLEAPLALAVRGTAPASIPTSWLRANYQRLFDSIFSADPNPAIAAPQGVTRERFAMAIAAYERTLVPDQAPIDTNTMTKQEQDGFDIVVGSGCATCHSASGNLALVNRAPFTGPPIGTLTDPWDNSFSDGLGHDIFFTDPARSIGRIKTPTLRNVGLRQRFFHDGRGRVVAGVPQNTLPDIVDFYDIDQDPANGGPGGPFELRGATGPNLTSAERAAVIAFLGNALTDPRVRGDLPPFDRPRLRSEVVPFGSNLTKPASPAVSGWQPVAIANTPDLIEKVGGPSWWKVGVGSANGLPTIPPGSSAMLFMGNSDTAGGPFWLTSPTALLTLPTTAQGFATAHNPAPTSPIFIGASFFVQWMVIDPVGFVGFSEAARITMF